MASESRHASPALIKNGQAPIALERIQLGKSAHDGGRREDFVEQLVHDHPEIIPMAEIEPAFAPLISICRQLPTSAGPLDNFWLTPQGGIVLGECKLFRNPQARREVIAQALDYARAIAEWHYEDLETAVQKQLRVADASLWSLMRQHTDLEEAQFIDAVERRLRQSRFMILIIGDGIQEGVEALAEHLQLHAGLHVGLALLDLSIWTGPEQELLIIPRVPMKTVLVERGIVTVDETGGVRIEPPRTRLTTKIGNVSRAMAVSEQEFYAQLDSKGGNLSQNLRKFVDSVVDLGISPIMGASSMALAFKIPRGGQVFAGTIESTGNVWFATAVSSSEKLGAELAGRQYINAIDGLAGNILLSPESGGLRPTGRSVRLSLLLDHHDEWRNAISHFISELLKPNRTSDL